LRPGVSAEPVTAQGWYFATGYKLSQSKFAPLYDKCPCLINKWAKNSEFTFRYETYQNVAAESLTNPDRRTNLFKTNAYTIGYNYYIDAYRARLQANYVIVDDPHDVKRGLREVKNNMFVLNWQVQF